jgi:hypothetical protein
MALKQAHMLLKGQTPFGSPPTLSNLIVKDAVSRNKDPERKPNGMPAQTRRTRIWDFSTNLHCSIIGTCLSTAKLRHVLEKVKVSGAATASDHDLHCLGVTLASDREGGRFLQKALDHRHRTAISRYAKAKHADGLLRMWKESLRQGDIPGAYWAALTHPAATQDIVTRVFADVHMLSHLVGAANRADIRRLQQLEADNAVLAAKVERQQRQLYEGFVERDRKIRELTELLARQASERSERQYPDNDLFEVTVHDLIKRLTQEIARREHSERHVSELSAGLKESEQALRETQIERECYRQELNEVEGQLAVHLKADCDGAPDSIKLPGLTLLYVGGRPHQIPQLKHMIERAGARFLHHDGGIEHSSGLIAGLISRADRVFFPTDCISHDAVAAIKRHCQFTGKVYEPLRTASLACLLSALGRMTGSREPIPPKEP